MPNWINLTLDDLQQTKAAALVDALRTAALGQSQPDPMPGVFSTVAARLRAEIQACPRNLLDADPLKIPYSLKSLASRMTVREMQSRLQLPLNAAEVAEERNDLEYLKRIALCEVPIETTVDPGSEGWQLASAHPRLTARRPHFKHHQQEGL